MRKQRKLTDKQLFALRMVVKGLVKHKTQAIPNFPWTAHKWVALDSDITTQVVSLRKRRLIQYKDNRVSATSRSKPKLEVTDLGREALRHVDRAIADEIEYLKKQLWPY